MTPPEKDTEGLERGAENVPPRTDTLRGRERARAVAREAARIIRATRELLDLAVFEPLGNTLYNSDVKRWTRTVLAVILGAYLGTTNVRGPVKRPSIPRVTVPPENARIAKGNNAADVKEIKGKNALAIPTFEIAELLATKDVTMNGRTTKALLRVNLDGNADLAFAKSFAEHARENTAQENVQGKVSEKDTLKLIHPQSYDFLIRDLGGFIAGLKQREPYNREPFKGKNYKVLITSLGRPEVYKSRVRRGGNRNVATESMHTIAFVAADISYAKLLDGSVKQNPAEIWVQKGSTEEDFLKEILNYLSGKEKDGTIFFAREEWQTCYHVGKADAENNTDPVATNIEEYRKKQEEVRAAAIVAARSAARERRAAREKTILERLQQRVRGKVREFGSATGNTPRRTTKTKTVPGKTPRKEPRKPLPKKGKKGR